ncbi:glycosyltransferase family 17 protein [Rhodocollybia butyracea]|jgi:beta-1,4-mannosyl-glycoprotein beta-1,4-N-acetylglucosaminyltransferase|uniref:Glycosyltransferase family 17 protein n=1 Tax=Rhodocollybia butyracea TaxID=206335 RepID=A0A9P5Q538_9AGAR|nr:glycosyltransferase family 17 protein [Rhodocollybia butyracea]
MSRRYRTILLPVFLFTAVSFYFVSQNHYQLKNTLSYATRPLWDKDDGPSNIIPHFFADGMVADENMCKLHNWKPRENTKNVKVLDAILMSSELDLLEVRLNELDPVVDRFFIVESNTTFTGLPKEKYFDKNRSRFEKFAKKISYRFIPGPSEHNEAKAWDVERDSRSAMHNFIRSHITEFPPDTEKLVIMSDLDEIPFAHSIMLLKGCDFGQSIHLQMRNYIYSFEWMLGLNSWRASVQLWNPLSYYRHSKSSENVLADSGWHCSFCFRDISEFIQKMRGYSHSDRIGGRMDYLDPARIQQTICRGKDLFGMLPEAYSFSDLLSQMSLTPITSGIGLPQFILLNPDRFRFLLPGGCMRETPKSTSTTGAVAGGFDDLER